MRIFINREKELELLVSLAISGKKILIKGRRGIGKSMLAIRVLEELRSRGLKTLYVNCLTIASSRDLLNMLSKLYDVSVSQGYDKKSALDIFFEKIDSLGIGAVVLDEITNLFYSLGRRKEFGGISNFANMIRGYIVDCNASIIATTSSMSDLRKIIKRARILGRTFNFVMTLSPFTKKHSIELVKTITKNLERNIEEKSAEDIALLADFVPFYIEAITHAYLLYGDLNRTLEAEFTSGTLAEYFNSLFEDLNPTQRLIMLHLGTGRKKYEELVELVGEEDVSQALSDLLDRDLVAKIVISKKNVFYTTKDRTFASWVVYNYYPIHRRKMHELLQLTTLSFEAFVRETLGALPSRIRIRDYLGKEIILGPFANVSMHRSKKGQIDILAVDFEGKIFLGECYWGAHLTARKLKQLEKFRDKFPEATQIVFLKEPPPAEVASYAKKHEICIITLKELKQIRKHTPLYPF